MDLGLIGGSGLDRWGGLEHELSGETPFGSTSSPIAVYEVGDTRLLFIPRHGQAHTIPPHRVNYRANLWALRQEGAQRVLAVNSVGGIGARYTPGSLVVPDQLVDYTWGRAQSYSDNEQVRLQHVEFAEPFAGPLRQELLATGERLGLALIDGACIGVMNGPRLETAAEIHRMDDDGCDLVGMTSMPETSLARELGLDYASICVVANWAAGVGGEPITMEAIEATQAEGMVKIRALIEALCGQPPPA